MAANFLRSSGTYLPGCMTSHLAIRYGFLHNFKLFTQGNSQYLPALIFIRCCVGLNDFSRILPLLKTFIATVFIVLFNMWHIQT